MEFYGNDEKFCARKLFIVSSEQREDVKSTVFRENVFFECSGMKHCLYSIFWKNIVFDYCGANMEEILLKNLKAFKVDF